MTRRARPTRASRKRPRRKRRPGRTIRSKLWLRWLAGTLLALFALLGSALVWVGRPMSASGSEPVEVEWPAGGDVSAGTHALAAAGLVDRPALFAVWLRATGLVLDFREGPHLLERGLSPAALVRRLARLDSRPSVRATVPEGFNQFQVAARLEKLRVCSEARFLQCATDRALLGKHGIPAATVEGYLFPATYDFRVDTDPADVLERMVQQASRRFDELARQHDLAVRKLSERYGFGRHEVVTLASVVEKEAAVDDERPLIASVFFNRLDDPDFRPAGRLQSDPTAAYGCLVHRELPSCRSRDHRVTPAMLRDSNNSYNTYRHSGLPPGPIANPGREALEAVLDPAETDYLFFVATGNGRHAFSRTLDEHRSAIRREPK